MLFVLSNEKELLRRFPSLEQPPPAARFFGYPALVGVHSHCKVGVLLEGALAAAASFAGHLLAA